MGIFCVLLDIFLLFLLVVPLVGFDLDGFLCHLTGISTFCLLIPYTYSRVEKML